MQATLPGGASPADLSSGNSPRSPGIHVEGQASSEDSAHFKAMFDQYMHKDAMKIKPDTNSLGSALARRTSNLAGEVKQDQQYVSKLLEHASRTGDSMQLMKAMMALNDYQIRVQTISKTVSKASSSVDSLTKLQ